MIRPAVLVSPFSLPAWAGGLLLLLAALVAAAGPLAAQGTPPAAVLPPPGSITTLPAAPRPPEAVTPPAAATPTLPGDMSSRVSDVEGPVEVMLEALPTLSIRGRSTWDDGFDNLTEVVERLFHAARAATLNVRPPGKAVFLATDDTGFNYDAILELVEPVVTAPRLPDGVTLGLSPAGRALRFTHRGAYDDIDTTYEVITAYLDEKGLVAKGIFIEHYVRLTPTSDDPNLEIVIDVLID